MQYASRDCACFDLSLPNFMPFERHISCLSSHHEPCAANSRPTGCEPRHLARRGYRCRFAWCGRRCWGIQPYAGHQQVMSDSSEEANVREALDQSELMLDATALSFRSLLCPECTVNFHG